MQYSLVAAAVLAFTSSVFAQTAHFAPVTSPTKDQQVAAGSVLEITWLPSTGDNTGPIDIQLLQGQTPSTLEVGATIATAIDQAAGKYSWTVPTTLQSFPTYGFKITLDSTKTSANPVFQFSFPFHVTGLAAAPQSSAPAGTTSPPVPTPTGPAPQQANAPASSSASVNCVSAGVPVPSYPAATPPPPATYPTGAPPAPVYPVNNGTNYKPPTPSGTGVVGGTPSGPALVTNGGSSIAHGGLAVAAGMVLALAL